MSPDMLPRGFRNNNPLNIRIGNAWLGELDNPTDREFEQFTSMLFGLRAGFILIRRYMLRFNLLTIEDIISRWAPASENHTSAYIRFVSSKIGVSPDYILSWGDKLAMCCLVDAMALYENGKRVSWQLIQDAYDMVVNHN